MTHRQTAIALLLRSLDWFEPQCKSWTPELVRRQSNPGDGPSHRIDCPECKGLKLRRIRGVLRPCQWCGGSIDEDRPGKGYIEVDDYTERRIGDVRTHLVSGIRTVPCDACDRGTVAAGRWSGENNRCLRCSGSGVIELTESEWRSARTPPPRIELRRARLSAEAASYGAAGDPVAAAIDRRDATGSYWELGLALGALRLELPQAYATVVTIYVEGACEPESVQGPERLAHDVGMAYLDRLLSTTDPIKVPHGVAAAERRRRERLKRQRRQGVAA